MPAGVFILWLSLLVLKLEGQTRHKVKRSLRVVVSRVTPHIAIGSIGGIA
jgi:hypothetical protein